MDRPWLPVGHDTRELNYASILTSWGQITQWQVEWRHQVRVRSTWISASNLKLRRVKIPVRDVAINRNKWSRPSLKTSVRERHVRIRSSSVRDCMVIPKPAFYLKRRGRTEAVRGRNWLMGFHRESRGVRYGARFWCDAGVMLVFFWGNNHIQSATIRSLQTSPSW